MKQYFDVNQLPCELTLSEAALYLRHDQQTLAKLAKSGELPAYKITDKGMWLISRVDLLEFQRQRKEKYGSCHVP